VRRTPAGILFLALALALPLSARGAELRAVRTDQGPRIDGRLDDPVWQSAVPSSDFRMVEPVPDSAPSERTEIRILYDASNLYIGLLCLDSSPGRISANSMAHDAGGGSQGGGYMHGAPEGASDDVVRVLIDPFQDKRTAYIFFVNPISGRGEGLAYAGSSSLNWDGVWEAKSRITDRGWTAELRIPFKTISFNPALTSWGINVERIIARKQETIRLSGTTRDSNFYNPMEAAGLIGIQGIRQGLGLTFRPYGLGSLTGGGGISVPRQPRLDGGFDIYKSFTPNLVGVVSYNMDFAETEVDERRINLTRFPLFFPEKRMFFLEGSETFSFSSSVSFMPFFSRRVGLYEGQQVPVIFGTKLYGKVGNTNLSVLDVQTGAFEELAGQNLFAARVTQNIFSQSKVGFIVTNGSPTGGRNTLLGLDFNYSTSKFLGNKNLMLAAWTAYNWNDIEGGRHGAFGFRGDFPNDLWNIQTTYAYYGESLDPGLGYMMRSSMQTAFARVGFQPRPTGGWLAGLVRQFFLSASADYYWDLRGRLETGTLDLTPLSFRTPSGERVEVQVRKTRDVLPGDFEVASGVVLPAGGYDFTNIELGFDSSPHRPVSVSLSHSAGQFYSGHLNETQAGVLVKLKGYAVLDLNCDLVRGRLPEGNFSENVYQVKADVFLTPDLGLMNYVQYDDISRLLGWSARLRWQVSPGNEIFLVYNKNWERRFDPLTRFYPLQGRGVLKLSLSIRP
jgi:hypothetical protein